jgi:hypothetical protein
MVGGSDQFTANAFASQQLFPELQIIGNTPLQNRLPDDDKPNRKMFIIINKFC